MFLIGPIFRLLCYSFLVWIPGKQGLYGVPVFFLLSTLSFVFNKKTRPSLTTEEIQPLIETLASIEAEKEIVIIENDEEGAATPSKKSKKKKRKSDSSETVSEGTVVPNEEIMPKLVQPKPKKSLSFGDIVSFVVGNPSKISWLNWISFTANLLLFVMVVDSIFTPVLIQQHEDLAFSRVASTESTSVNIIARIPPHSVLASPIVEESEFIGAKLAYRLTKPLGKWSISDQVLEVTEARDWTGVVTLSNLFPSTEYEYRLLLPSASASHHPSFPKIQKFITNPDYNLQESQGSHFTFASSSCIRPNFPYKGPLSHTFINGAVHLEKIIVEKSIKFLLFLGDFIYADVPFYSGRELSHYHQKYRQVFASAEWQAINIPVLHAIDDHEIINDYHGQDQEAYQSGIEAFRNYVGSGNPKPVSEDVNYFEYRYGDAAYFVLDARSYRSPNGAEDNESKTMLGSTQKSALLDWLGETNQTVTFKFIVSSTPFMSLWGFGEEDTWSGFMHEREELLDVLEYVPNVIILSGDRHEVAVASLRTSIIEFSCSPLSQFYLPTRTLSQENAKSPTDLLLKYLPDGNSKFCTFEVDTRIKNQPIVKATVIIDGEEAWSLDVLGKPLVIPEIPQTLGSLGLSLLELLGFKRRSWF